MSDELTILLDSFTFKPNHERYVQSLQMVRTGTFRNKEMRMYEVAWYPSIQVRTSMNNPYEINDRSNLYPIVWITDSYQLAVKEGRYAEYYDRMVFTTVDQLSEPDRQSLLLGLQGRFDEIDADFEVRRKASLRRQVESAVRGIHAQRASMPSRVKTLIEELVNLEPDSQDYVATTDKLLKILST